jgi:arylsulfatase A-like enzyme
VRPHYGVVTDRYKLVRFYATGEDYWELFDREKDPLELKSVYNDPAYATTKAELEKELARLRKELKVPTRPRRISSAIAVPSPAAKGRCPRARAAGRRRAKRNRE